MGLQTAPGSGTPPRAEIPPMAGTPLDAWARGVSHTLYYTPRPQGARVTGPGNRTPITVNSAPLPTSEESRLIGSVLGNFRIIERLGAGGMGTVYLGKNELIGSKVAVKVLHPSLANDPMLVERFHAEARAANLVGHENLVRIFDLNRLPDGGYYLVMEYLEGQPLSALLGKAMAPERAVAILSQTCQAVAAAHEKGVVHRDLKPENIFLIRNGDRDDFVKVVDFGIAKLRSSNTGLTATGTITGTPEYMSPEQWHGAVLDHRVDIYALGVTAWAMLAGEPPFRGEPLALYAQHCTASIPSLRARNPNVSEVLERAIFKALEKDRDKRWPDGKAMARALEQALEAPVLQPPPVIASALPPVKKKPEPPKPQFKARFTIQGKNKEVQDLTHATASDLRKGSVFLQTPQPHPALRTRGQLTVTIGRSEITTVAEVVHLVCPQKSAEWNTAVGFAVEFCEPSHAFVAAVNRTLTGESSAPEPVNVSEDADVTRLLREIEGRKGNDPYRLLELGPDAEQRLVTMRLRLLDNRVAESRKKSLPAEQQKRLDVAAARIESARKEIGEPATRAMHDALRVEGGNFRGVARCIGAGLRDGEIQALRREFFAMRPGAETAALVNAISARAQARGGSTDSALREWEAALTLDPLNLEFHREYWSLLRTCKKP